MLGDDVCIWVTMAMFMGGRSKLAINIDITKAALGGIFFSS
jgi:hypothetical protein